VAREVEEQLGICLVGRSAGKAFFPTRDYITDHMRVGGKVYNYRQVGRMSGVTFLLFAGYHADILFLQYEGTFTQPNGSVCELMLAFAADCASAVTKVTEGPNDNP
jgi:tRNA (uracil-5-)-methyltransferase